METLPAIPATYSPSVTPEFSVDTTKFGDGYELRRPSGLNSVSETWSVSWDALTRPQYETLYSFLVARKGVEAFSWRAPWDAAVKAWVCTAMSSRRPIGPNVGAIQATFKEDHNL